MAQTYNRELEIVKFLRSIDQTGATGNDLARLTGFYDEAVEEALGYCNRDKVMDGMAMSIRDLAKIRFNQDGAEGESSRSEGGVSQTYEEGIPRRIRSVLNRYRVAKVGRF